MCLYSKVIFKGSVQMMIIIGALSDWRYKPPTPMHYTYTTRPTPTSPGDQSRHPGPVRFQPTMTDHPDVPICTPSTTRIFALPIIFTNNGRRLQGPLGLVLNCSLDIEPPGGRGPTEGRRATLCSQSADPINLFDR